MNTVVANIRLLPLVILGIVAVIAQVVIAPNIAIGGTVPQFLLVYVVLMALRLDFSGAAVLGFVVGLVSGLITTEPIGLASFALTLIALFSCFLKSTAFSINLGIDIVTLAVVLFLGELLFAVLYALFAINNNFFQALLMDTLPSTLYDFLIGALFMVIIYVTKPKTSTNFYRSIDRKLR